MNGLISGEADKNLLQGDESFQRIYGVIKYQEFPHILWKTEVYYHARNITQMVPILSQMNPVDIPTFFLYHLF
jgi:hypothetical protein